MSFTNSAAQWQMKPTLFKKRRISPSFRSFSMTPKRQRLITPRVVKQLSTKRVLTMSRLYGAPLTDLEVVRKYARDPRAVLEKALSTWFQSLALVGFFTPTCTRATS
jgi:predicted unusual protein kinase regulating ubiquinone biosynthesis (AarF/ABC1/UbiB family)